MKQNSLTIATLAFLLFFTACSEENNPTLSNGTGKDCVFVQDDETMDGIIDDTERSLMDECKEKEYRSKDKIEENLIGEWELVGHGQGWFFNISQPCGYVTFKENTYTLEYENMFNDTIVSGTWEILNIDSNNGTFFTIDAPSEFSFLLSPTTFCPKYFYGDATPRDGNMYLWEKVE